MQKTIQTGLGTTRQEIKGKGPHQFRSWIEKYVRYDPVTGKFYWIKSTSNRVKVGDEAGCYDSEGYVRIRIGGKLYHAHRLAWLLVYGELPLVVDHIDGYKYNNMISNLRGGDYSDNNANKAPYNTTGIKYIYQIGSIYRVQVYDRKTKTSTYIGQYASIEAAIEALERHNEKW